MTVTNRGRGGVNGAITGVTTGPGNESEFGVGFRKECDSVSRVSFCDDDGDGWDEMRSVELRGR